MGFNSGFKGLIARSSRELQLVQNSGDQCKAAGETNNEQEVH